jgi:hypothetical protein
MIEDEWFRVESAGGDPLVLDAANGIYAVTGARVADSDQHILHVYGTRAGLDTLASESRTTKIPTENVEQAMEQADTVNTSNVHESFRFESVEPL